MTVYIYMYIYTQICNRAREISRYGNNDFWKYFHFAVFEFELCWAGSRHGPLRHMRESIIREFTLFC